MAELEHFRVCVVGAGPTGLATLRNLQEAGIDDIVCHESRGESGGIWVYSDDPDRPSVYKAAHTISSRQLSQFRGFPMPDDYPDYPSHRQVLAYMRAFEAAFGLARHIRLNSTVEAVRRRQGGGWVVTYVDATGRHRHTADYLFVCSGHHRRPTVPELQGHFAGSQVHSGHYKTPAAYAGKRVLVVGGGNSACDIAAELSRVADHVSLSFRSPQYILPKLVGGRPLDVQFGKLHKPMLRWARRWIIRAALAATVGPYGRYGLPQPDFPVLSRHPTLNTAILDLIRHGKVTPRRGIARADGHRIGFADGSEAEFDAIVWATGFRLGAAFLEEVCPDWGDAVSVPLYHKMMLAGEPDLYFIGLIQPVGCIWVLAELQARVAAAEILGKWTRPPDIEARIAAQIRRDAGRYKASPRHAIQVDTYEYRAELEAILTAAGV